MSLLVFSSLLQTATSARTDDVRFPAQPSVPSCRGAFSHRHHARRCQHRYRSNGRGYSDHRGSLLWAGACVRSSVTDVRTPASRHHYMIDVCRSVSRALHARRDGSSPREGNSRNGRRVGAGLKAVFCSSRDLINQTPGDGYATAAAFLNNTSTFFQAWS